VTTLDELKRALAQFPETEKLKIMNSTELKPFNVYKERLPRLSNDENQANGQIKEFNDSIKTRIPVWLSFTIQRNKDGHLDRHISFDSVAYGDLFLEKHPIETFPALMEGAIYENYRGSWRTFGKGENNQTIESRTARELLAWGLYSERNVIAVRKYMRYMMWNEKFGKHSPFDQNEHPELVAFANGTYDMLKNRVLPNNPHYYLLNAHDYAINPDRNNTPETDSLLKAMMGEAAETFMQYIGYCFYQSYAPYQEMLWLHGEGGEGKSTLLRFVRDKVLGIDNCAAEPPQKLADSNNRFATSNLYGKEANMVADVDKGFLKGTAILKKLSGGDPIDAEYKGIQGFNYINYAKLIFSANDLPAFGDNTSGFRDRLIVIDLINGDVRVNRDFWKHHDMKKVEQEAPAFAVSCMQAFAKMMNEGHGFAKPQAIQDATQRWLDDNDHFGEFLKEAAVIDLTSNRGESAKQVLDEYTAFCRENNYSDKTTATTIKKELARRHVKWTRNRKGFDREGIESPPNVYRYIGLRLTKSYINPMFHESHPFVP
jgi:putative DNA primase/helicase